MKKYKLTRMAALGIAASITVSLSACSLNNKNLKNDSMIDDVSTSESIDTDKYIDYKYSVILAEDSDYKCNVSKTYDNVGALVGSCYTLPERYNLYTTDLDKQFLAVPSVTLEDGTQVFALTDEEALSCVGITPEAYDMLAVIDGYEKQILDANKEVTEGISR